MRVHFSLYERSALCWMLGMDHDTEQKQRMETLAARLLAQPQLSGPIEALLAMLEEESALTQRADEIEEQVIAQVRALGRASLQHWAEHACAAARPASAEARSAHRHSKKNSGG